MIRVLRVDDLPITPQLTRIYIYIKFKYKKGVSPYLSRYLLIDSFGFSWKIL
jgi:hypothetical protein